LDISQLDSIALEVNQTGILVKTLPTLDGDILTLGFPGFEDSEKSYGLATPECSRLSFPRNKKAAVLNENFSVKDSGPTIRLILTSRNILSIPGPKKNFEFSEK